MADCRVEMLAYIGDGTMCRAAVVHGPTGRELYVTWPYRSHAAARARARRWINEEYEKIEKGGLFDAAR